mgnify:CR=1 FL=1
MVIRVKNKNNMKKNYIIPATEWHTIKLESLMQAASSFTQNNEEAASVTGDTYSNSLSRGSNFWDEE